MPRKTHIKRTKQSRRYVKNKSEKNDKKIVEVVQIEQPNKDEPSSKQKRLTKDQKMDLLLALDKAVVDGTSKEEIANKFGISVAAVLYHAKKFGISFNKAEEIQEYPLNDSDPEDIEEAQSKTIESEATEVGELVELHKGKYIVCGLVADRHSMPTRKYVFGPIDEETMFDYDKLDSIVEEFIKENINFKDGIPDSGLSVYITGLPCCSASVIKVCHKLKVNLKLKHYNIESRKYATQTIWNEFALSGTIPDNCNTFDTILEKNIKVYINKQDFEKLDETLVAGHTFYMLTESHHEGFQYEKYKILYSNMNDAFLKFSKVSERIQGESTRTGVYIDRCYISANGTLHNELNLAKGYNFRNK